jgi:shikimate kinase
VGLARDRPVLALNPRATLAKLLEERATYYDAVATARIVTDERTPDDVVDDVVALVRP